MSLTSLSTTASIVFTLAYVHHFDYAAADPATPKQSKQLICQQYGDKDPHGDDPHGPDPHDENHDPRSKANSMDDARTATDNVYGTKSIGSNSQHPLDNFPGQPGL